MKILLHGQKIDIVQRKCDNHKQNSAVKDAAIGARCSCANKRPNISFKFPNFPDLM